MSKLAVIKTGGKQYKVQEGDTIQIEKVTPEQENIKFDTLLTSEEDGTSLNVGNPSLGEKVEGQLMEQTRGKKVNVVKYKNKIRYKKSLGHKQHISKVKITQIS